jgi:hypothetical protein
MKQALLFKLVISFKHNKRIKFGTTNSLLGSTSYNILANYYSPLNAALAIQGDFKYEANYNFNIYNFVSFHSVF